MSATPHPKPVIASGRLLKKRRQLALDASEQIAIMCAALREMMRHDGRFDGPAAELLLANIENLHGIITGILSGAPVTEKERDFRQLAKEVEHVA